MTFLNSILNQSKKYDFPFDHWEYNNALSENAIQEIITADIHYQQHHVGLACIRHISVKLIQPKLLLIFGMTQPIHLVMETCHVHIVHLMLMNTSIS